MPPHPHPAKPSPGGRWHGEAVTDEGKTTAPCKASPVGVGLDPPAYRTQIPPTPCIIFISKAGAFLSVSYRSFGALTYQVSDGIGVPHGFTTRLGGVSTGHVSALNLALRRDSHPENVAKNFHLLGEALGFDPRKLVLTCQTHSALSRAVTFRDHIAFDTHDYPQCDALITNTPGTALCIFTADCTPILLWDPVTGAVGAVHAGWRGTAAGICSATVGHMATAFGCDPTHIHAAIGPNIGACCFETDKDVPDALLTTYGDAAAPHITERNGKYFPDLKAINALDLRRAGVTHIALSQACTACRPDLYWSHRITRGQRGSQGAIIVCKEATP